MRLVEVGGGRPDTDRASSAVAAARRAIEGTADVSMVRFLDNIYKYAQFGINRLGY